MKYIFRC